MLESKRRCLRIRHSSGSSSSADEETRTSDQPLAVQSDSVVVEAVRELQKVRKRPAGISLIALSTGKAVADELVISNDPFKIRTGGLVDMKVSGVTGKTEEDDDVEARLAKTFATETNKRDEDAEMIKYIEEEIARRKGLKNSTSPEPATGSDLLRDVPEHLRPVIGQQREDMLSNQMLCGIPEVDLGVEAKMRNIEATEDAKQSLMKHRFNSRFTSNMDGLAPSNIAVNFVQHSRWNSTVPAINPSDFDLKRDLLNISSKASQEKQEDILKPDTNLVKVERERLRNERATDSLVLQRFKTHMRDRKRR